MSKWKWSKCTQVASFVEHLFTHFLSQCSSDKKNHRRKKTFWKCLKSHFLDLVSQSWKNKRNFHNFEKFQCVLNQEFTPLSFYPITQTNEWFWPDPRSEERFWVNGISGGDHRPNKRGRVASKTGERHFLKAGHQRCGFLVAPCC